jgi:competence protein ComGC
MDITSGQNIATQSIDVAAGQFSAGAGNRAILVSPVTLVAEHGMLKLKGRYQKPGAGRLAVIATIITFVAVILVAQALGFAAGPGYLIWYYIFSRNRRADIELDLANSLEVVTDDAKRRIAIRIPVDSAPSWIGISPKNDYPRIISLLSGMPGVSLRSGSVKKSLSLVAVVILIIVCCIGILAAVAIPNLMEVRKKTMRQSTQFQLWSIMTAIETYEFDKGTLPEKLEELIANRYLQDGSALKDAWGREFIYHKGGDSFILKSLGKDGIESQDDIVSRER